jgi:hypothetical protein
VKVIHKLCIIYFLGQKGCISDDQTKKHRWVLVENILQDDAKQGSRRHRPDQIFEHINFYILKTKTILHLDTFILS